MVGVADRKWFGTGGLTRELGNYITGVTESVEALIAEHNHMISSMVEYMYQKEIVETCMEALTIGDGMEYCSKEDWKISKMMEFKK